MKRIVVATLVLVLSMAGCAGKSATNENPTASGGSAAASESAVKEQTGSGAKCSEDSIEKTEVPYILEKVENHTVGLEMTELTYSSEMVRGDDGSYYYFREKGNASGGKRKKKLVFYRDKQIKVCEIEKPKGEVYRFTKYKDCIYLEMLRENDSWLAALHIESGKLRYVQKWTLDFPFIIFYKNSYYGITEDNQIIRYDLNGKQMVKFFLKKKESEDGPPDVFTEKQTAFQKIIDDKIYYTVYMPGPGGETAIIRRNLDGSGKEVLFRYTRGEEERLYLRRLSQNVMTIYHNYIYILDVYSTYGSFYRIPLHGGNIEKITARSVGTFELKGKNIFFQENTDDEKLYMIKEDLKNEEINVSGEHRVENFVEGHDSIYFVDRENHGIYKTSIKQPVSPAPVADITARQLFFSDGNLIVKKYMKEDEEEINKLYKEEIEVNPDYAPEYCWINSKGKIIGTLEGVELNPEKYFYFVE